MESTKPVKTFGNFATGPQAALLLLVGTLFVWQTQAVQAQIQPSGTSQASNNRRSPETAEKKYSEAAAFSKKLTQRDLREAVRLYRSSAESFRRAGLPQRAAAADVKVGDTLNMMSDYVSAMDAYRHALIIGSRLGESACAALTGIAWTEGTMGRSEAALRDASLATTSCTPLKDTNPQAYERAVEAQGEAEFYSEQVVKATATLTLARQLAAAAGDADGEALSAMLLAYSVHPDNPEAAHRLIASAMELWTGNGNLYGAARGNLALAYFAGREGNYSAADCRSRDALTVFERIADRDNSAVTFNVLGMVARRSGDLAAAADAYRHAQKLFIAAHDVLGEGDAVSGLMDVSVERNDTRDSKLYARGVQLAQTTRNQGLLATALIGTGDVQFRERRFALARTSYQGGLDTARKAANQYEIALALGRLAQVAVAQSDPNKALDFYAQALALEQQAGAIENVARTQYLRARIYLARSEPDKALTEIEKTIAIIEKQRLRIAKFESRAQYFAWVHEYYALYIRILMAFNRNEPDGGYARRAFEASERSKVRGLIDELANVPQTATCNKPQPEPAQSKVSLAPAKADTEQLGTLENTGTAVLSLQQLQPELQKNGTALVEFALGEEQSFAWLVDGSSITSFELTGAARIHRLVDRFRQALQPAELRKDETPEQYLHRRQARSQAAQKESRELGEILFGSVPLPATRRLIIVPDGTLQYLPFAALVTSVGTPLVQQYELTMLPSFNALIALRKSTEIRAGPQDLVAVIADPVYELTTAQRVPGRSSIVARSIKPVPQSGELTRALNDLHQPGIPNLPGSRLEALSIQKIFGLSRTRLTLGYDANREAVLDGLLEQARVVHFATHGLLDAQRPEDSGLVLALFDSHGQPQNGYLRVSDVRSLRLSADLVVLSACESALGKDMGSEGIIGLPRAFLYAGAHRVISSLWKVDDEAAAVLMAHFYEELKEGKSPAEALSRSQLTLRRNPRFHDPYFWSAFFLEGEYK